MAPKGLHRRFHGRGQRRADDRLRRSVSWVLVVLGLAMAAPVMIAVNLITRDPPDWLLPYRPYAVPVFIGGWGILVVSQVVLYAQGRLPKAPSGSPEEEDRHYLIHQVEAQVEDALWRPPEDPRPHVDIDIEACPELVEARREQFAQRLTEKRGPRVLRAFDAADGNLLLTGDAGAGKSQMLMELAQSLLDRARRDALKPVPVLADLASWSASEPLTDWLVEALRDRFQVPPELGEKWVNAERVRVLLLLDGLDQTADPASAVAAINAFREDHGEVPVVVCSRSDIYRALPRRLWLDGAVQLQPLTDQQVESYLAETRIHPDDVYRALGTDGGELLRSPLMLEVVTSIFREEPSALRPAADAPEQPRSWLLGAYVETMLRKGRDERGRDQPSSSGQTLNPAPLSKKAVTWLSWLGRSMRDHHQPQFRLDRLDSSWLATAEQRQMLELWPAMLVGPVVGSVFGLASWFIVGTGGELAGLLVGLVVGGVSGVVLTKRGESSPFDALSWSWSAGFQTLLHRSLRFSGPGGILLGSLPNVGLLAGMALSVSMGIVMDVPAVVSAGLTKRVSPTSQTPNEGILRSARYAMICWLLSGLFVALSFALMDRLFVALAGVDWTEQFTGGLGVGQGDGLVAGLGTGVAGTLSIGLLLGLAVGLLIALKFGGLTCVSHLVLRVMLARSGHLPLRSARFLDYAVDRVLLRRVGGAYEFIHPLFLEHFAEMENSTRRP